MDYKDMNFDDLWEVYEDDNIEEKPIFIIDDVSKANWAMNKINDINDDFEFYKSSVDAEIEQLKLRLDKKRKTAETRKSYLLYLLDTYIKDYNVKTKKTKTQESLELANGKFVKTLPKYDIKSLNSKKINDDEMLINFCKEIHPEFIKTKEEVAWGDFKKALKIKVAEKAFDVDFTNTETGEIETITIPKGAVYSDETKRVFDFIGSEEILPKLDLKPIKQMEA